MTKTARERFESRWIPEPNTGCWLWMGYIMPNEYGQFSKGNKHVYAHRFAWELYRGPIPAGMVIDHVCRVRSCVNPDHLRVVTFVQNLMENSMNRCVFNKAKTVCGVCGGPYTVISVGVHIGKRKCDRCMRRHYDRRNAERRAARTAQHA